VSVLFILKNPDSLAGTKAVSLYDNRILERSEGFNSLLLGIDRLILCSRKLVFHQELLGKVLASLQPCSFFVRSENLYPRTVKHIHYAFAKRIFGSDYDQINILHGKLEYLIIVLQIDIFSISQGSRIPL